jgi:hypothetical protein
MDESLSGDRRTPKLLNEEQVRVLRAECQRNQKSLTLARALIHYEAGRFPLNYATDWYSTNLGHSQEARIGARLLRHDAILRANARDIAGALQNVRAILNASRAIGDEPFLISQLVRMAVVALAVAPLERTLGLGEASDPDLRLLQQFLAEEARTPYYLIGTRGERAGLDRFLDGVQNHQFDFSKLRQTTGISPSDYLGTLFLMQVYVTIRSQRAEVLECMTESIEIAKLPAAQQKAAFAALDQKFRQMSRLSLARLITPACSKVAEADLRTKAVVLTAMAGLAAERFRLAKGRWPKDLAELVPAYLEAVPLDPFDGQPLRLKRSAGTFVVYSVGIDGVDNEGQLDDKPYQPGSDIGFRLFDVDRRRQPAVPFVPPPKTPVEGDEPGEPGNVPR